MSSPCPCALPRSIRCSPDRIAQVSPVRTLSTSSGHALFHVKWVCRRVRCVAGDEALVLRLRSVCSAERQADGIPVPAPPGTTSPAEPATAAAAGSPHRPQLLRSASPCRPSRIRRRRPPWQRPEAWPPCNGRDPHPSQLCFHQCRRGRTAVGPTLARGAAPGGCAGSNALPDEPSRLAGIRRHG